MHLVLTTDARPKVLDMDAELRAHFGVPGSPHGVCAVFIRDITEPGLDGARFELAVADHNRSTTLQAIISGTLGGHAGMEIEPEVLEAAVEIRAERFERETRLDDLLAGSPLALRREDLLALL